MGILAWIVVGLIAGWLAGTVMKGGVFGGWIFGALGIWHGGETIGSIIVAFVCSRKPDGDPRPNCQSGMGKRFVPD